MTWVHKQSSDSEEQKGGTVSLHAVCFPAAEIKAGHRKGLAFIFGWPGLGVIDLHFQSRWLFLYWWRWLWGVMAWSRRHHLSLSTLSFYFYFILKSIVYSFQSRMPCATIQEMNRNKDIICTAATVNKCSRDSWSCVHACLYIQTTESKVLVPSLYDR